ncbi:polycystin family receptor for egg jelly-like isoform X2 [Ptychodera flava]|uniref:polycystin family receptor for egg jelly-like isoform X2 n=1 Tax=Ptychodera flava TaxID=63121 RepID=UPI00396A00D2
MALWVNIQPPSSPTSNTVHLVVYRPLNNKGFHLEYSRSMSELVLFYTNNHYSSYTVTSMLETGKWAHVVVTGKGIDASNAELKIYINGDESSGAVTHDTRPVFITGHSFVVGYYRYGINDNFYSMIDDLWYWNDNMELQTVLDGVLVAWDKEGYQRHDDYPEDSTLPTMNFYAGQLPYPGAETYGEGKLDELMFWEGIREDKLDEVAQQDVLLIGCYERVFTDPPTAQKIDASSLTPGMCRLACARSGKKYAGISDWDQCSCGDTDPPPASLSSNLCHYSCPGSQTSNCGGHQRQNIWHTTGFVGIADAPAVWNVSFVAGDGPYIEVNETTPINITYESNVNASFFIDFGHDFYVVEYSLPSGSPLFHSFPDNETYTVTLLVSFAELYDTYTYNVTVEEPVERITNIMLSTEPTAVGNETIIERVITTGNHLHCDWDFGDGEYLHTFTMYPDFFDEVRHAYRQQGVYEIYINCSNRLFQFNTTTTTIVQVALTEIDLEPFSWAFGKTIELIWTIPAGTNVSFSMKFDGKPIVDMGYVEEKKRGWAVITQDDYIYKGEHGLELNGTNKVSFVQHFIYVMIMDKVERPRISHFKPYIAQEEEWTLTVEVDRGSPLYFVLDYGDYSPIIWMITDETKIEMKKVYPQDGNYPLKVYLGNYVEWYDIYYPMAINPYYCNFPYVRITGIGRNIHNPRIYIKSEQIVVGSIVTLDCAATIYAEFHWRVTRLDPGFYPGNFTLVPVDITQSNFSEIVFPPGSFDVGRYNVSLTVSMVNITGIMTEQYIYMNVTESPLVARIKGGSSRVVAVTEPLEINAEEFSYDPDVPKGQMSDLMFEWYCTNTHAKNIPYPCQLMELQSSNMICFGQNVVNVSKFEIPPDQLDVNSTITVAVNIRKGQRSKCFGQVNEFQTERPPTLSLECKSNCGYKMNPSSVFTLNASCESCSRHDWENNMLFHWTLKVDEDLNGEYSAVSGLESITSTGIETSGISFKAHTLQGAVIYKLRLYATLGDTTGFIESQFITNIPPFDGFCNVQPKSGYVLETPFEFACYDWVDEGLHQIKKPSLINGDIPATNSGLMYEFRTRHPDYGNSDVFYYGPDSYTVPSRLPMGNPDLYIDIRIYDSLGAFNVTTLTVTMKKRPDYDGTRTQELFNLTQGEESELKKLLGVGNTGAVTQIVTAAASEMNIEMEPLPMCGDQNNSSTSKTSVSESFGNDTECVNKTVVDTSDQKIKIRSALLETMLNVTRKIQTPSAAQQSASALREATAKTDELTKESTLVALDSLDVATRQLSQIQSTSDQDIAASKDLVRGLGYAIKAGAEKYTSYKDSISKEEEPTDGSSVSPEQLDTVNRERDLASDEESQFVQTSTNKALATVHQVAMVAVEERLVGQDEVILESDTISVQVMRGNPRGIANKSFETGSGNFTLPSVDSLPQSEEGYLNVEVLEMKENYLSWDLTSNDVKSPVIGLSFTDIDNQPIPVSNTSNWYQITFMTNFADFEEVDAEFIPDENDMDGLSFQSLTVDTANSSLSIIIRAHDPWTQYNAFVRFNDHPSIDDYDFATSIPHELNLTDDELSDLDADIIEELQYTLFLPSDYVTQTGLYILGLQEIVLNATEETATATSTSSVTSVTNLHNGSLSTSNESDTTTFSTSTVPTTVTDSVENSSQINTTEAMPLISTLPSSSVEPDTNRSRNFTMTLFSYGCRYWDEDLQSWSTDGCKVSELSNRKFSRCLCNHLTSFGSDFFVPPNTINFKQLSLSDLEDNLSILITVLVLILIYIILLVWGRRADQGDFLRWGVLPLIDNRAEDEYLYQVTVITGVRSGAGTKSRIQFQVFSADGNTDKRILHDGHRELFLRGGVDRLLMAVPKTLGELLYIKIWHDNSGVGENRSWFLNQLELTDVQTNEKFYFLCDRWLAVDEDDGKVSRILPVAGRDNLLDFSHLFLASTRKNFSENHLWFSVVSRPTRSSFNRVQRVSCCFALLFLTMITSAMFYRDSEEEQESLSSGKGLELGPIRLSYKEIYVAFISILIVSPASLIIVQLFRKCEEPPNDQSLLCGWRNLRTWARKKYTKSPMILFEADSHDIRCSKKKGKVKTLAWYWVYIAWILVFLSIALSGIFLIMYSMEWKKEKSERWLTSMVVAVCNSLLITEPLKVLVLAFFVSLIFKKPAEEDGEDEDKAARDEIKELEAKLDEMVLPKKGDDSDTDSEEKPKNKTLEEARKEREQEVMMKRVIHEVFRYFLFLFLLISISNNNGDDAKFYLHKSLVDTFTGPSFKNIKNTGMLYEWMNKTLLPGMYPQTKLNGKPLKASEKNFISTMASYRIGPPRLRQLRVIPDGCEVATVMQDYVHQCNVEYSMGNEEERNFGVGWTDDSAVFSNESIIITGGNPWAYRSTIELAGMPITGKFATYSGGGYEALMGTSLEEAVSVTDHLYTTSWIDKHTRAIFVEFTLYNAQVNLFALIILILEYPATGSVFPGMQIDVFRLYDFMGGISHVIFMMVSHTIYALTLLYNGAMILYIMKNTGKRFFKQFWNIIDFTLTVLGISLVVMYLVRYTVTLYYTGTLEETDRSEFLNFQYVASLNELYTLFIGLVVFFAFIKALHLLRFNQRIGMLAATIKYASETLVPFSVLFSLVLGNFAAFGFLRFGRILWAFASFISSLETLLQTFIGKFYLEDLSESIIGPLYFVLFSIICFFILLNMLVSIVVDAFTQVRQDASKQSNDYEIVDFMILRFTSSVKRIQKKVMKKLRLKGLFSKLKKSNARKEDNLDIMSKKMDEVLLKVTKMVEKQDRIQSVPNPMRMT